MLLAHVNKPPPPPRSIEPSVPEMIERAILRALVKAQEGRFQTVDEFLTALTGKVPLRRSVTATPIMTLPAAVPPLNDSPTDAALAGARSVPQENVASTPEFMSAPALADPTLSGCLKTSPGGRNWPQRSPVQHRPRGDRALSHLKDWEGELTDQVEEVRDHLAEQRTLAPPPLPPPSLRDSETHGPDFPGHVAAPCPSVLASDRLRVTIRHSGNGHDLDVGYYLPGGGRLGGRRGSRAPIAEALRQGGVRNLDELGLLLGRFDPAAPHRALAGDHLAQLGQALFDALFGRERKEHAELFRQLFNDPEGQHTGPNRAPLRLLLRFEDDSGEALRELPWRLLRHRGDWLCHHGWTVEIENEGERASVHLPGPCQIVFVHPARGAPLAAEADAHLGTFREVLERLWPGYAIDDHLYPAAGRAALAEVFRHISPHIVYVFAAATCDALQLDGDTTLPLTELPNFFPRSEPPSLLYLNLLPSLPVTPIQIPPSLLGAAPCVIAPGAAEPPAEAAHLAQQFFDEFLGHEADPVAVLQACQPLDARRSMRRATLRAFTRYQRFSSTRVAHGSKRGKARLHLDRKDQRSRTQLLLTELADAWTKKVLSLVAYAERHHHLDVLARSLYDHLRTHLRSDIHFEWIKVPFPVDREPLVEQLEDMLMSHLTPRGHQGLREALGACFPPSLLGGARHLIIGLDWGTLGAARRQPLSLDELLVWLEFGARRLVEVCPPGARLVSYLAIETVAENHGDLQRALDGYGRLGSVVTHAASMSPLQPLADVTFDDLLTFFSNADYSTCPDRLRHRVCRAIMALTGGRFDAVLHYINEAERGSWFALAAQAPEDEPRSPLDRRKIL